MNDSLYDLMLNAIRSEQANFYTAMPAKVISFNGHTVTCEVMINRIDNDRALPRGKVFMCDTREVLDKVAKNNNADWSIQDNELVILPKEKALDEGFIISSDTGMIGSPRKTDRGIEVTTLCNPEYKIGGLVQIQSRFKEYSGDFKIQSIRHAGDILADDWFSHLTCISGEFENE